MKRPKVVILIMIICGTAATAVILNSPPNESRDCLFTVHRGETIRSVAMRLRRENVIRCEECFFIASRIIRRSTIRAGRYRVYRDMTMTDVLRIMARGEVIAKKVTIPEGFNLFQIAERLDAAGIVEAGSFIRHAEDASFLATIGIDAPTAEGYLFPATYLFPEGSEPREVLSAMHRRMVAVIDKLGVSVADRRHILTIASLVEKEAKIPAERPVIASVFYNRLRAGMKLDCDPTVRYAAKRFTGPIRMSDLNVDSPYNTYRRHGLPPTPICMPGRDSILAALRPAHTEYLYFVAKNDGSHHFSVTLAEHEKAVRRWQR